ncbi:MAG: type I DNA topoisomerase [Clostridia bacterium]|nr:type I DNA topoisomerase [Clostridia bacterium]
MDLIIVESPSKAQTISKYLKGKYKVEASKGHIRDLPERTLGVSLKNDYEPKYVTTAAQEAVVKHLLEAAKKADKVYLATDPDREGEAISWHLQTVLGLNEQAKNRIEFNEISPTAVERALQNPRVINYNLVDAQQARRVLDRLVGYKLSPLLNNKIQNGLSAGRVQSVVLKLVVEREREITAFKPEEYWTVAVELQDGEKKFSSFKANLEKRKGKKFKPCNKTEADEVLASANKNPFVVQSIKRTVAKSHAPAPFTTSTLQQDASTKFGMSSPETMLVAQHLYEGMDTAEGHIAFITYIRTDSTRVSAEAQQRALSYIKERYGAEYCPQKPNYYVSKKGAQDAHEAIRPNDLSMTPERAKKLLDKKHYNVYKLVYDRFVASQMSEAKYNSMQMDLLSGDYTFKASGKSLLFAGFTAVYQESKKEDEEEVSSKLLPPLSEGDTLDLVKILSEQKFTKPPLRYTDASLIKLMEEKGIGRPSTFSTIVSVLNKRKYVLKEGKYMVPTPVAYKICDLLEAFFKNVMDVRFTAEMEEKLDDIENGGKDWRALVGEFYPDFVEQLKRASNAGDEPTDEICAKCGSPMVRKSGKYGKYLACTNYPQCSNIVSEGEAEISQTRCPKCGANMVVKSGKFGKFLACPNYPECKCTLPFVEDGEAKLVGVCPDCGRPTRQMKSKAGKIYYSCTAYPECKFMSWNIPTGKKCPVCGGVVVQTEKGAIRCAIKTCTYIEKQAPMPEKKAKKNQ